MDTSSKCRRRSAACRGVSAVSAAHFEGEDVPGLIIPPLRGFREGEVERRAGGVMSTTANAHDPRAPMKARSPLRGHLPTQSVGRKWDACGGQGCRFSLREYRQGYATTLLSSVKNHASSPGRIILSYRQGGCEASVPHHEWGPSRGADRRMLSSQFSLIPGITKSAWKPIAAEQRRWGGPHGGVRARS